MSAVSAYATDKCLVDGVSLCELPDKQEKIKMPSADSCYSIYLWFDKNEHSYGRGQSYTLKICERSEKSVACSPAYYSYLEPKPDVVGKKNTMEVCEKDVCKFVNIKDDSALNAIISDVSSSRNLEKIREEMMIYNAPNAPKDDKEKLAELKKREKDHVAAMGDKRFYYRGTKLNHINFEQDGQVVSFSLTPEINNKQMAKNFYANGENTFKDEFALKLDMFDKISGIFDSQSKEEKQKVFDDLNKKNEAIYKRASELVDEAGKETIFLFQYDTNQSICADQYYKTQPMTLTVHYGIAGLLGGYKKFGIAEGMKASMDPKMIQERILEKKMGPVYKSPKGKPTKGYETEEVRKAFDPDKKTGDTQTAEQAN